MSLIVINADKNGVENKIGQSFEDLTISFPQKVTNEEIEVFVRRKRSGKTEQIMPRMSLLHALEFDAHGEGFFYDTTGECSGTLPLAVNGGLFLDNDDVIILKMYNMSVDATSGKADCNYTIDGIPSIIDYSPSVLIKEHTCSDGQRVSGFGVKHDAFLKLPDSDNLEEIVIHTEDGQVRMSRRHLQSINRSQNDIACVQSSKVDYGFRNLLHVDLIGAAKVEIVTNKGGSYDFYTVGVNVLD